MRKGIQRRAQVLAADDPMRRRDFLTVLAVATAWASAVRGQEPRRVLGFLSGFTASSAPPGTLPAFIQGLKETGFVEGGNVSIEFRWADGHYDRLPSVAAELVGRNVAVIFAYDLPSALAAKAATKTIPIVFSTGTDPVKVGLVASLSRPTGNLTGASFLMSVLGPKHVELLHELLPAINAIALVGNPSNANFQADVPDIQTAADTLKQRLEVLAASTDGDLEVAFATMVQHQVGALIVMPDPFFISRREQLVGLAARHAMPAIYPLRAFADDGGLMSYGGSLGDLERQLGVYVGKILNGAKPADLPVQQSTKMELVINLKTAKALGLTVPPELLATADEVIE
jgi:putative tryptophan/tyrosine transport system substrate-binding protein